MTTSDATSGLPKHVAIIMDGNGRWAKKRHLPREAGHYAGMKAVRETVRAGCDIGLENLTCQIEGHDPNDVGLNQTPNPRFTLCYFAVQTIVFQ